MEIEATAAVTAESITTAPGGELGKEEFLNLLMVQMQNQDPLDPIDSATMVAQLAQFSALEQMQNLNEQFDAIRMEQSLMQALVLQGQDVNIELSNGSVVEGIVDKVLWTNGVLELQINDTLYAISDIVGISLTQPATVTATDSESVTEPVTESETEEE